MTPEASESENRYFQFQGLLVVRNFGNSIRKSDALCFISDIEGQDNKD
jgi:hypothetical protein